MNEEDMNEEDIIDEILDGIIDKKLFMNIKFNEEGFERMKIEVRKNTNWRYFQQCLIVISMLINVFVIATVWPIIF